MPTTDTFYPKVSSFITASHLPDQLDFFKEGLASLFDKLYFKDLQSEKNAASARSGNYVEENFNPGGTKDIINTVKELIIKAILPILILLFYLPAYSQPVSELKEITIEIVDGGKIIRPYDSAYFIQPRSLGDSTITYLRKREETEDFHFSVVKKSTGEEMKITTNYGVRNVPFTKGNFYFPEEYQYLFQNFEYPVPELYPKILDFDSALFRIKSLSTIGSPNIFSVRNLLPEKEKIHSLEIVSYFDKKNEVLSSIIDVYYKLSSGNADLKNRKTFHYSFSKKKQELIQIDNKIQVPSILRVNGTLYGFISSNGHDAYYVLKNKSWIKIKETPSLRNLFLSEMEKKSYDTECSNEIIDLKIREGLLTKRKLQNILSYSMYTLGYKSVSAAGYSALYSNDNYNCCLSAACNKKFGLFAADRFIIVTNNDGVSWKYIPAAKIFRDHLDPVICIINDKAIIVNEDIIIIDLSKF